MKKFIIGIIIGLFLGIVVTIVGFNFMLKPILDPNKQYGNLEIVYYLSQPIGVLGTFLAIIVAIFGNEIKNFIFSAKCMPSIKDEGFTEDLGDTDTSTSPKSQLYKLTLLLTNNGVKELNSLQLVVKEVLYSPDKKKFRKIGRSNTVIFWGNPDTKKINLRATESREIILARIMPEAVLGTPDATNKSPLRFSITGANLDVKYSKKGYWKVKYRIETPKKIIRNFEIDYSWSGKWFDRINEMSNEVTSNIL